jgi:6-phosphofructokinase 1
VRQGSTFLGSFARSNNRAKYVNERQMMEHNLKAGVKGIRSMKLDGIIVTGGNGALYFVGNSCKAAGIKFVGIPKTIDNDTPGTDVSLGFSSAVDVAVGAIDNAYWTSKGHRRAMVIELMGRDAGHLAMAAGVASAADAILVPEIKYSIRGLVSHLRKVAKAEKRDHFLVVVSEGAGREKGFDRGAGKPGLVARYIETELSNAGFSVRSDVLGHIQRGSMPNGEDRMLAQKLGAAAVETFLESKAQLNMVAIIGGRVRPVELGDLDMREDRVSFLDANSDIVSAAKRLGIYIGDI